MAPTEAQRRAGRAYYERNKEVVKAKANAARYADKENWHDKQLWYKHKLTPEAFRLLWQSQNGCCYLCERELDLQTYAIDHDHDCCPKTKSCEHCRRGITHRVCNVLIGLSGDDVEVLQRIVTNLRAANKLLEGGRTSFT